MPGLIDNRLRADERGVASVLVIIALPMIVILMAFAIDLSRWWMVARHMQTQADAGALAAGTMFGDDPLNCTAADIENRARQYAGIGATVAGEGAAQAYNRQSDIKFDNTVPGKFDFRFNNGDYPRGGSPDPDRATYEGQNPCLTGIADVKLTTKDTPWLFDVSGIQQNINAHARVQLLRVSQPDSASPFALETSDPKRIWVEFVDLADPSATPTPIPLYKPDGTQVTGFDLTRMPPDTRGLTPWANTSTFQMRSSPAGRIGARVRVSDALTTVDCSSVAVRCYGTGQVGTQQNSLSAVRFYDDPDAPGVTGVRLGAVDVTPSGPDCDLGSVTNGTEGGFFHTTCTHVDVVAHVEGLTPQTNASARTMKIGSDTLTYVDGSEPSGDPRWQGRVSVPKGAGAKEFSIEWQQLAGDILDDTGATITCLTDIALNPCKGTFTRAHRSFSGDGSKGAPELTRSGIIRDIDVSIGTGTDQLTNNIKVGTCSTASPCPVTATVSASGSIGLSKPTDPPILLRTAAGSLTGLLDCDPAVNSPEWEIAYGCPSKYAENENTSCAAAPYFDNPNKVHEVVNTTPPSQCAGTEQGTISNAITGGMNARAHCIPVQFKALCTTPNGQNKVPVPPNNSCHAKNNWPNFDFTDPRIIQVFLVETGASALSGGHAYPILGFAAFYVTAWDGNTCSGDVDSDGDNDNNFPAGLSTAEKKDAVAGHWVKYVPPNIVGGTNGSCNPNTPVVCVPVLVR